MGNTLQKLPENSPPTTKQREIELEEEKQQEEEEEEFTCEICIEPTSNKFKNGDKCLHPFCVDCMIKYIRVKLYDDNDGHIQCPAVNCNNELDPFAWAPVIGAPLFVRWCDVLCEEALVDRDKCYCPNLNCNSLIVNECGGNPAKSKCPSCKSLFCFQCKGVWHKKFRCGQNKDLTEDANDVAFARLVASKGWVRCSRCRSFVAKAFGCRYIKCRCRAEICYRCGSQATDHLCPKCNKVMQCHCNMWCYWGIGLVLTTLLLIAATWLYIHGPKQA